MNDLVLLNIATPRQSLFYEEMLLRTFGILSSQFEVLGLRGIKTQVKHTAYDLLKKHHPDVNKHSRKGKGWLKRPSSKSQTSSFHLSKFLIWRDRILNLAYMPMTYQNFERILALKKGFKSTDDIDFGLNGPDNDKTAEILPGQVYIRHG